MSLIVFLSIGIFAFVGCLQAAESNQVMQEGQKAMMEGAKQMMDANKRIMDIMAKHGKKDAELTAAEKMMSEGYDTMVKGHGMMSSNATEGQEMVKRGAKMMLDAQQKTEAEVEKQGMTQVCASDLHECHTAQETIHRGALQWFFGAPGF